MPLVSIVVVDDADVRRAADFRARVHALARALEIAVEIVAVGEGDADLRVELSRGFGFDAALLAGASAAHGDWIFFCGHDPDEGLSLLDPLWRAVCARDADWAFVRRGHGRRVDRWRRAAGRRVARWAGLADGADRVDGVLLARRDVVHAAVERADDPVDVNALFAGLGFEAAAVSACAAPDDDARAFSHAVVRALTTSPRVLGLAALLGTTVAAITGAGLVTIVARRLLGGIGVPGYAALITSTWLLGGMILMSLGVLGLYLANILGEVGRGSDVVVRAVHRRRRVEPPTEPLVARQRESVTS